MKKQFGRSLADNLMRFGFVLVSAIMLLLGLAACSGSSAGTSGGTSTATTAPNNTPVGATAGPRLSFKQTTYEVGQINRNADNGKEYRVPFTNGGTASLTISDVKVEPLDPTT